ncbi:pyridoxamine 5'-phosphate oxidase family protein [Saliphagus infecundisoli]|uniref:Pyridoxamine 5'-phosphate oxidase family protein n=1 Tax=Saliphagus infecundisoli TaxID=1849069 RepID=A0ABD5QHP6_9EURY|nr:pyridoxamine 5'-phosphate oxidase family protein [Saliphagus infecundisoli]
MEIVENTLEKGIEAVLDRPLFCFLGAATPEGRPRISPLWFLWEDECVWIIADTVEKSYAKRVRERPETALAVVDFDPTEGLVRHVGMRGEASIVPLDGKRVEHLLGKYLGPDREEWDPMFHDLDPDRWGLIRFEPETVVARDQSYAGSLASVPER